MNVSMYPKRGALFEDEVVQIGSIGSTDEVCFFSSLDRSDRWGMVRNYYRPTTITGMEKLC